MPRIHLLFAAVLLILPALASAQEWASYATISAEPMPGRICTGDANGKDILCAGPGPYIDPSTGYVGIGTTAPGFVFHVLSTNTATSGTGQTASVYMSMSPGTGSAATYKVMDHVGAWDSASNLTGAAYGSIHVIIHNTAATLANISGASSYTKLASTGTITTARGSQNYVWANAAGTIGAAIGSEAYINNAAGATITTAKAGSFYIVSPSGVATGYGIHIGNIQATTKYSLYASDSTAPSYFAGSVGIGTTSSSAKLEVAGTIKVSDSSDTCTTAADQGKFRFNPTTGKLQICH